MGISRHPNFLSSSDYVLGYAELLLSRGNKTIFRSLMERAIASCNNRVEKKWEAQKVRAGCGEVAWTLLYYGSSEK